MPALSGLNITDASGNRLTDASAAYITERSVPVLITASGLLMDGQGNDWRDWFERFLKGFQNATDLAEGLWDLIMTIDIQNALVAISNNLEKLTYVASGNTETYQGTDHTYSGYTLNKLLADIAAIEPGEGMTEEEHNHLIGLVNTDLSGVPDDVWGYMVPSYSVDAEYSGQTAYALLGSYASYMAWMAGYEGLPIPDRPHFRVVVHQLDRIRYYLPNWINDLASSQLPILDLSLVQEGDTVLSYLEREYDSYAWSLAGPGSWPIGGRVWLQNTVAEAYYYCTLTDEQIVQAASLTTIINNTTNIENAGAPVWPGQANITTGAPVALADELVITTPMDGVIVTVTTPPQRMGRYVIGSQTYDYGVGRIAFGSDGGELEPWQYLGFRAALFTPKSMKRAASVHLQLIGGAEGTITPWTVS